MRLPLWISALVVTLSAFAQGGRSGQGNPVNAGTPIVLSSDKLELTISSMGGRFQKLQLRDGDQLSPYHSIGHFLALDGFGAPTPQEQAAGMPFHGEASHQPMKIVSKESNGPVRSVVLQSLLPLAQEELTGRLDCGTEKT